MREREAELTRFAESVVLDDFQDLVLLGMGGSSLAPEVIRRTFQVESLHVLDTTHPTAIRRLEASLDLERTLFVGASKSGGTIETRSHLDYFWEKVPNGRNFAAITDPGSALEKLAWEREFRAIFHGEPTIGGRYSALSVFGLVPAAIMGVRVDDLLDRAEAMADACKSASGNPGLELGLALALNWEDGRDKVCVEGAENGFGLWVEQLIAESTGKDDRGLVPAPGEDPGGGPDRQGARVDLRNDYDLGAEFFRWEFATAVAGAVLGINPFDQPHVQAAKDRATAMLEGGDVTLPEEGSLDGLLAERRAGDYLAIQAFVDPAREEELEALAERGRAAGLVVTIGLGPRYLHSTGQLHKGGANNVLCLQVVDDHGEELAIPGREFGFRRLIAAQAAGDYEALREKGRRVARIAI